MCEVYIQHEEVLLSVMVFNRIYILYLFSCLCLLGCDLKKDPAAGYRQIHKYATVNNENE